MYAPSSDDLNAREGVPVYVYRIEYSPVGQVFDTETSTDQKKQYSS